jgi:hypothetical protein
MKVLSTNYDVYVDDKSNPRGYSIKNYARKYNADGPEILKWMRSLAKIKSTGLVELPKFKGAYLGRFIDTNITVSGYAVIYTVGPYGLMRVFVEIENNEKFSNNGSASRIAALSRENLLLNILRYKEKCDVVDPKVMNDFINRFKQLVKNGGSKKRSNLELVLNYFSSYKFSNDKLSNENIEKYCGEIVKQYNLNPWEE